MKIIRIVVALTALLFPVLLLSQGFQVGSISGVITDPTGAVLPGVSVTATSEERANTRTEVTDTQGRFRIPSLPLGTYRVEATLSGFQDIARDRVRVESDKTSVVDFSMRLAGAAESITVTAAAPIVDPTNQATTTRLSTREYERAPITRSYQGIVGLSPGATSGTTGNPTVNGALSSANQYLFDGVDTTDPTTGTFGANLNFEAIQEVAVQTTGMSAEYGRSTGAVVNVITKSGTNSFNGSLKLLGTNDQWNTQNTSRHSFLGTSFKRPKLDHTNYRETATLGGPIWRDRIWAFGALEKNKPFSPSSTTTFTGEEFSSKRNEKFANYRADWQITSSQHLWAKYADDPINGILAQYVEATDLNVITNQTQGGDHKIAQYNGVFGSNFSLDAMYGTSSSKIGVFPSQIGPFDNGAAILDQGINKYFNGMFFGVGNRTSRPREQIVAAGTYFAKLGDNTHEFKAGVDNQQIESLSYYSYGNNRLYIVRDYDWKTGTFTPIQRRDYDDPGPQNSQGKINAFYVRDRFAIGRRFNSEVGLRYEKQDGHNDIGQLVMKASSLAPRLAASFDITGNAKTLLSATGGRYYDFMLQGFTDAYAQNATRANYDRWDWNAAQQQYVFLRKVITAGGSTLPPALDLHPGHMDEFTLGVQQQLGRTMGVTVRGVYRKWDDVVEDLYDFDSSGNLAISYLNYDGAKRDYKAIQTTFDKRFSDRWSLYGNYTYSQTKGNFFSSYASTLLDFQSRNCRSTDPTVGTIPCSQVVDSQTGYASYDVPHIVNLIGTYGLKLGPVNLTYGAVGNWRSGFNYSKTTTMQVLDASGTNSGYTQTYYYEGRGSDRLPNNWQLDNSLEATFGVFRGAEVGVKAEVFNVLNSETAVNTATQTWCAADTAACATTRSRHGAQTSRAHFQTPRSFRFTALLRF